jgi:superfamily II DNA or RNA helicase
VSEPATVVLPTGTGKTKTMLPLFASERPGRVLVLVPSERLRAQIADTAAPTTASSSPRWSRT